MASPRSPIHFLVTTAPSHQKRQQSRKCCDCRDTALHVSVSGTSLHRGSKARRDHLIVGRPAWALIAFTAFSVPKHPNGNLLSTIRQLPYLRILIDLVITSPKTSLIKRSLGCNVKKHPRRIVRSSVISRHPRCMHRIMLPKNGLTSSRVSLMKAGMPYVNISISANLNSESFLLAQH